MLEVGLLVTAASAGIGAWKNTDREKQEQRAARDLYARFFKDDFLAVAPEAATLASSSAPSGLNAQAAACVKIIESYQENRRYFKGMLSFAQPSACDTRTRILEELKLWCLTLPGGEDPSCAGVFARLEYCRQLLLLQSLFTSTNTPSFLETIAEVCKQLERLLQQAMSRERAGVESLGRLLDAGRDLVRESVPVLLYSLPDEASLPERAASGAPPLGLDVFDGPSGGDGSSSGCGQPTRARTMLQSLLGCAHVRALCAGGREGNATASSPPWASGLELSSELEDAQREWVGDGADIDDADSSGRRSGLRLAFRGPMHKGSRSDYLKMCEQVDRVAFFLHVMRPFHHCAVSVGDIALCALREPLVHVVRELEGALAELRLARKQVARAAKRGLQDQVLATRGASKSNEDVRWAQGLQRMQDASLDGKHAELEGHCSQVRAAAAQGRQAELQGARARELREAAERLQDPDFVVRSSQRPPLRLADSAPRGALANELPPQRAP